MLEVGLYLLGSLLLLMADCILLRVFYVAYRIVREAREADHAETYKQSVRRRARGG